MEDKKIEDSVRWLCLFQYDSQQTGKEKFHKGKNTGGQRQMNTVLMVLKKLLRGLGSCISGSGDTGAGRRRIPAKNSFMVIGSGSINGGISCVCGLFH